MYGTRANLTVEGIGKRKNGTGQFGPYDFIPVCVSFQDPDFLGKRCAEIAFQTPDFPANLKVGEILDAVYTYNKGKMRLAAIMDRSYE